MDYWVAFYEGTEVVASFIIEGCPSEVVALSESMGRLKEGTGFNQWAFDEEHRIMICHLSQEDKIKKNEESKQNKAVSEEA